MGVRAGGKCGGIACVILSCMSLKERSYSSFCRMFHFRTACTIIAVITIVLIITIISKNSIIANITIIATVSIIPRITRDYY